MLHMQRKDELQAEQWHEVKAIEQQFNALSDEQRSQYADTVRIFEAIRDNHDVLRYLLADLEDG